MSYCELTLFFKSLPQVLMCLQEADDLASSSRLSVDYSRSPVLRKILFSRLKSLSSTYCYQGGGFWLLKSGRLIDGREALPFRWSDDLMLGMLAVSSGISNKVSLMNVQPVEQLPSTYGVSKTVCPIYDRGRFLNHSNGLEKFRQRYGLRCLSCVLGFKVTEEVLGLYHFLISLGRGLFNQKSKVGIPFRTLSRQARRSQESVQWSTSASYTTKGSSLSVVC